MKTKNLYYILLFISLCASCKCNSSKPDANALITKFNPIIQGVWVKKDYIEKIARTKSPLAAANLADGITTFVIDSTAIKADSLKVPVGYGNHEGGELYLKFEAGKRRASLLFGGGELAYSIHKKDTILTYYYTDGHKRMAVKYIRALKDQGGELGSGTYSLVNKAIISGRYAMVDSLGNQSVIAFTTDGKISGLSDYSSYQIQIDLNSGPMTDIDEIGFDAFAKKSKWYHFRVNADTVNIYDVHPNADSTELVAGKLKYKLVKIKLSNNTR